MKENVKQNVKENVNQSGRTLVNIPDINNVKENVKQNVNQSGRTLVNIPDINTYHSCFLDNLNFVFGLLKQEQQASSDDMTATASYHDDIDIKSV